MARIEVRVQARAGKNEIAGERNGALVVRVAAAPVDGKANEAVRKLLAKRLGVPRSSVAVLRGQSSRDKLIEVEGIDAGEMRRALGLGPAG